jgi:hypothetical protein
MSPVTFKIKTFIHLRLGILNQEDMPGQIFTGGDKLGLIPAV